MPLLHVGPRVSALVAAQLVAAECEKRGRTFGLDGFKRREPATESERHQLSVYPASPLLPRVVVVRHAGQP